MLRGARPGGSVALIYTFLLCCAHYCHHGGLLLCARLQRFRMLPLMFSVLLAHVRFSAVRGCSGPSPAAVSTNAFTASARASEQHKGRFSQAHTHTHKQTATARDTIANNRPYIQVNKIYIGPNSRSPEGRYVNMYSIHTYM